jgi:hypothetical protein
LTFYNSKFENNLLLIRKNLMHMQIFAPPEDEKCLKCKISGSPGPGCSNWLLKGRLEPLRVASSKTELYEGWIWSIPDWAFSENEV